VILNFWTTWCTACLGEIPALVALQRRHEQELVILGISLDSVPDIHGHFGDHGTSDDAGHDHQHHPPLEEIRAKVERTVKKLGINYPVLLDERNVVGGRFNGGELPTTVFVDPEGNIRRRFVGARALPVFEAMLAEVLEPAQILERVRQVIHSPPPGALGRGRFPPLRGRR
jgi:thiol-disulfide isomerase/thioredoxin